MDEGDKGGSRGVEIESGTVARAHEEQHGKQKLSADDDLHESERNDKEPTGERKNAVERRESRSRSRESDNLKDSSRRRRRSRSESSDQDRRPLRSESGSRAGEIPKESERKERKSLNKSRSRSRSSGSTASSASSKSSEPRGSRQKNKRKRGRSRSRSSSGSSGSRTRSSRSSGSSGSSRSSSSSRSSGSSKTRSSRSSSSGSSRRSRRRRQQKDRARDHKSGRERNQVRREESERKERLLKWLAEKQKKEIYIAPQRRRELERRREYRIKRWSEEHQRQTWFQLQKGINGVINRVTFSNIKSVLPHIFEHNLVRGKGLFARALMKAQLASPSYTNVYAAVAAVVNTKMPENGELLLSRVIIDFRTAFRNQHKARATTLVKFIAHLVNQQVAHEIVALQVCQLLLKNPTNDSIELATDFVKQVGQYLDNVIPRGLHSVFEQLRMVLQEGHVDKRVQFLIENLFEVRKKKFEGFPAVVKPDLDLVESEDQITHTIRLDAELDPETKFDSFSYDARYKESEKMWEKVQHEILGIEDSDSDSSTASSSSSSSSESSLSDRNSEEDEALRRGRAMHFAETSNKNDASSSSSEPVSAGQVIQRDGENIGQQAIVDVSEGELVELRKKIYLTIMSSLTHDEAGHKLLQMNIRNGLEMEPVNMIIECCSQEKTYQKYYGALAQRFCLLSRAYQAAFMEAFSTNYETIHRIETNKLRNIACLFAHLLYTDALPWTVFEVVRMTEQDTTSSSRIFVKSLCLELAKDMGIGKLRERFRSPTLQHALRNIMPKDERKNAKFSITFFTAIGLGALTDDMREYLKNAPQESLPIRRSRSRSRSSASSSSSSSSSSSNSSSSRSRSNSSSSSSSSSRSPRRSSRSRSDSRRYGRYKRKKSSRRNSASSSDTNEEIQRHRETKKRRRSFSPSRSRSRTFNQHGHTLGEPSLRQSSTQIVPPPPPPPLPPMPASDKSDLLPAEKEIPNSPSNDSDRSSIRRRRARAKRQRKRERTSGDSSSDSSSGSSASEERRNKRKESKSKKRPNRRARSSSKRR